ncbi:MAG TPA: endonuclease MutS2 [Pyrinomonadaceae bacterium]|nr:endonuclease MutS2 [Pyrinomonadaceae bacterium]
MQSLKTLEYEKLLTLFAARAQTPMGKARLLALQPLTNRLELERDLKAVTETIFLNEEKQVSWRFSDVFEPTNAIAVLRIRNATLEPLSLLEVTRLCSQALFARSIIAPEKENVPVLWQTIENLPPTLFAVIEKINRKLLPSGEIDDSASPELARLRREINHQRARLTKSLESLMRSASDAIQDAIVTQRNERYVVPVKADFRGKVTGVAHGFSSSGATVFIEPLEAIEANNELQALKEKEEREVARVLFDLTEMLRSELPAVEFAVRAVAELDFIKAKVEFARSFRAVVPQISDDETLSLIEGRHPLLEENIRGTEKEIVPVSFSLTKEKSVMIISGANAGGKTVVLKTAGLLSLMAISGLPVPAREARIPFYKSVLADIGDNQSLSANLSTFTSHISNIAGMMRECSNPALVLLDEVGTGTDPEEGSALGVAIVDYFRRRCAAQVIASTHYRGLKIYATNDETVINASVEFDEKTLQPTYRLLTGLAGASSGIEIARRFGIPPPVIEKARANVEVSAREAADYLLKIRRESQIAEDLRVALEEEREATAKKYSLLDIEARKREKERQKEFEKELGESIESFERQAKAFVAGIEDKALKARLEKEMQARKAELKRTAMTKVSGGSGQWSNVGGQRNNDEERRPLTDDRPIQTGMKVLLKTFGSIGTVEKIDGETAEVMVGSMRLREKISNLQAVVAAAGGAAEERKKESRLERLQKQSSDTNLLRLDTENMNAELKIIGKTTADVDDLVDPFLDEAYLNGFQRVRIVHGIGTGALKSAVHRHLKGHPHVSRYTIAPREQGGEGATIVELKQ